MSIPGDPIVRLAAILLLVTGLLTGCAQKAGGVPTSGMVMMTAPLSWEPYIGAEVQLIGKVSRTKVPTILGVEIDPRDVEPGERASAVGVVDAVIVPDRDPADPPVASRGPGTYYRLINPKTNKLAVAEPFRQDR